MATPADLACFGSGPDAPQPGVYLVGSGSGGVAPTFLTLGALHWTAMMTGALNMRIPRDGWTPDAGRAIAAAAAAEAGRDPASAGSAPAVPPVTTPQTLPRAAPLLPPAAYVTVQSAARTPQLYLLWTAVFGNAVRAGWLVSARAVQGPSTLGSRSPEWRGPREAR